MNTPAVAIKYPLPCGCAGPKYISMCDAHKNEAIAKHREMMGLDPRSGNLAVAFAPISLDDAIKIIEGMDILMLDMPGTFAAKKTAIAALKELIK
jgi:hypothetical protein